MSRETVFHGKMFLELKKIVNNLFHSCIHKILDENSLTISSTANATSTFRHGRFCILFLTKQSKTNYNTNTALASMNYVQWQ